MPHNIDELKAALREIARTDPDFFDSLLDTRFLRNPCPPARAGKAFQLGKGCDIAPTAHIQLADDRVRIVLGDHSWVNDYAWLCALGAGEGIHIGSHCSVNQHCMIQGGVTIGDGVRIGAHTLMIATDHNFTRRDVPIYTQGTTYKPIRIESDVYIGSNVVILGNVTVGQGAVIAAGAVVNRDVPPFAIVGGVPARVIKQRPGGPGDRGGLA